MSESDKSAMKGETEEKEKNIRAESETTEAHTKQVAEMESGDLEWESQIVGAK